MIVYMFHAIGELDSDDWADPHYSFSESNFREFLANVGSVVSLKFALENNLKKGVVVTFDDGHVSNYFAAKYIYENGYGTADFFINPEFVGNDFYMSWQQIGDLSEWGMSVQSHGLDHQYLSDCSDPELARQLQESKRLIEQKIGQAITILAPPGGRFDSRTTRMASEFGYQCIANSQPGRMGATFNYHIPRLAVLKHYNAHDLVSAQNLFSPLIIKLKVKYVALKIVKTLLGNRSYDLIRLKLLGDN